MVASLIGITIGLYMILVMIYVLVSWAVEFDLVSSFAPWVTKVRSVTNVLVAPVVDWIVKKAPFVVYHGLDFAPAVLLITLEAIQIGLSAAF